MDVPARLGEFELLGLLGEGGTGSVYSARKGDDLVALKVLRADLELTPREHRRFLDEASRMRRVDHPGIVRVLDAGALPDGRPFLTMPRLSGETLAARLARGPVERADALRWFDEIASAVATIHEAGLVHRDLKPENVFLSDAGRAILLDLGIAREIDAAKSTTTAEGKTRGTPAYMAPERFFGSAADVRTDIYELAVLLYLMLTATLPWTEASGPAGRLHPAHPEIKGVALPSALVTALLSALSTLPEKRPPSVRTFAESVLRASSATIIPDASRTTEKVGVVEVTALPHHHQRERKPSTAMAVALAAVAIVAVSGVGFATRNARSSAAPAEMHAPVPVAETVAMPVTPASVMSPAPSASPSPAPSASVVRPRTPARSSATRPSATPAASSATEDLYLDRH